MFNVAHASEAGFSSTVPYTSAQPATYTRIAEPAETRRRIVRVAQAQQPKAVLVNGTYQMTQTATLQRSTRRVNVMPVKAKLKAMPNLYKTDARSAMPVMYSREAMQAR